MITLPRILATALRHERTLVTLRRALCSTLVSSNPYYRLIVTFASNFWDEHHTLPKNGDYEFWVATLANGQQEGIQQALFEINSQPPETWTPDYIANEVSKVLKETATRTAVARLGQLVPDVPADAIQKLADEINTIQPVTLEGLADLATPERWIYAAHEDEERITSGFHSIDQYIGGFRKELVFILADTGLGKTSLLINMGAAAALHGARVLHLTFELSAENTIKRYYRRITEVERWEYRQRPQVVVDRAYHWIKMAKGGVHVLYQGAFTVGANDLRSLIAQYTDLRGPVDLVILDYLDLMRLPEDNRLSEHKALGQLSHSTRNLCSEYSCTILSATQASRGSHKRKHLRLDTMGDSYDKARAADIVLGLVQTDEEQEANQARIGLLKVRENPGRGIELPVYMNLDLMHIADLDHPNTRRLIAKYHHNPNQVFHDE